MTDLDKCPTCQSSDRNVAGDDCRDAWHRGDETGRPEDDVACPACGNGPGESCDGPASHPSRVVAASRRRARVMEVPQPLATDWVIEDIKVSHRCGFCGEEFGVRAKHVCERAAIDPARGVMLTTVETPAPAAAAASPACPTCKSRRPNLRFRISAATAAPDQETRASLTAWCEDAWHDRDGARPARGVHAPQIARTLMEGPGNRVLVRGCACGAAVMSDEAYAAHVGWPVAAVRSLLDLYGIADDLIDLPDDPKMRREAVAPQLSRCLEVRRVPPPADYATSGPYEIKGTEVVGPNLRVILEHVIELLHMRHDDDPKGLPTTSTMDAIGELVTLLNGAYDQGRRAEIPR